MSGYQRICANINLDAITHNFEQARKKLKPGTKVLAIVKADGYGHGAMPVANALADKADCFGVAIVEEAVELRENGITKPVLILGYTSPDDYKTILDNELSLSIFHLDTARKLSAAAAASGKTAGIHIVVDTGMNRIGFKDDDKSVSQIEEIARLPFLHIEGLSSHFACADAADKSCTTNQIDRFLGFCKKLEQAGVCIPMKHISNSAGIIDLDNHFDMVRLGISLYGLYPSEEVNKQNVSLIPALEWKSRVVFIKTVESGRGVSYGHTYITDKPTVVATVPVGYADGYPRALSSKGRVLINGQYAPVIGRVCMDLMMVDATGIDGLTLENEVTLVGCENGNRITVEELGSLSGSFNYEIVCGIAKRVPRVYFRGGRQVFSHSCFPQYANK